MITSTTVCKATLGRDADAVRVPKTEDKIKPKLDTSAYILEEEVNDLYFTHSKINLSYIDIYFQRLWNPLFFVKYLP